jgi:predicted glycoside hydrolase/deacetylase ChbG (UPF0249 family)
MKKLIINADDYGSTEAADKAVMECFARGAVTDMSVLAVGDSFEHAVKLAGENNINKIGVHLTLTGPFKLLTLPAFSGCCTVFLIKYFAGLVKKNKIYTEFKNQIQRVKEKGFTITHLDSHQHIHALPGVLKIVIELAKEENIDYIRFPAEKINIFKELLNPRALIRSILLLFMCGLSGKMLAASGIKHNDYFAGHARGLKLTKEDLMGILSNLKDGLTELGCHPGKREEERAALCDKDVTDELKTRSIELVSY